MNIVEPIKRKSDIQKIKKVLSKNKRNLLLFNLGINSGLRISDILALMLKIKNILKSENKKLENIKNFRLTKQFKPKLKNL